MKKIISIALITLTIFLIYFFNKDEEIYLLSLGILDEPSYVDNIDIQLEQKIIINKNLNQILEDIKNNKNIQNHTMKNHLVKADIIIINIYSKNENINELINEIKKISKEKIILIGHKTNENIKISRKYELELIDKELGNKNIYDYLNQIMKENNIL